MALARVLNGARALVPCGVLFHGSGVGGSPAMWPMAARWNGTRVIGSLRRLRSRITQYTEAPHPYVHPDQEEAQLGRTHIELLGSLNIYSNPASIRKTGIVCTIGPACQSVDTLERLIHAGMTIARLNFSHGDHTYHTTSIANIRAASERTGVPIAIALDTKGPEIRTSRIKGHAREGTEEVELQAGSIVTVTSDDAFKDQCDEHTIHIDYKNVARVLSPGNVIYLADGMVSLRVDKIVATTPGTVACTVLNHCRLGSQKGVNLPGARVDLPAVSARDDDDLKFGVAQGVDFVFASFIRKASDVMDLRQCWQKHGGKDIAIIAKIENQEGLQNISSIVAEADGVMVARGDLGLEIPSEKVFLAQKMIISKCNMVGKPVICATQMLESMVSAPRPTRAEGTDVANAVLDGTDCVMLSGETAKGEYPVETVNIMSSICREAEGAVFYSQFRTELSMLTPRPLGITEATCVAAVDASVALKAKAIICLSISGMSGKMIAKWRPLCPILLVTRSAEAARKVQIHRGVHTLLYNEPTLADEHWMLDVDRRVTWAFDHGKSLGVLSTGDYVITVHGWQTGPGFTNTVRILQVP